MAAAYRDKLAKAGVIITGHFEFASGQHATTKVEMDNVTPELITHFSLEAVFWGMQFEVDAVAGVPSGGNKFASEAAKHFAGMGQTVTFFRALKAFEGNFAVDPEVASKVSGKKFLLIDDVTSTGGSLIKLKKRIEDLDGIVVAIFVIWNRGNVQKEVFGNVENFMYIINEAIPSWPQEECHCVNKEYR